MPQPVKLSDRLVDAARAVVADTDRSVAGQIEHWASIGRAVSASLTPPETAKVKKGVIAAPNNQQDDQSLALLQSLRLAVSAAGQSRMGQILGGSDKPRYGSDPAFPSCLVRFESNGRRIPGHMVQRKFVPLTGKRA